MTRASTMTALLASGLAIALPGMASAQDGAADLATAATNPVGSANQLQFQNIYAPENKNSDGSANTFIVQPILSFALPEDAYFDSVVARFTIPYVSTPEVGGMDAEAWGDTTALFIVSRTTQGAVEGEFSAWGPVLALGIPTSTDDMTGADEWTAGPGFVAFKNDVFENGNSLMWGTLAWHQWDVDNSDVDVSTTSAIAIGIYKFDTLFDQKGWYLRLPDDPWVYDWEASEFTQIPAGLALGRAFTIGKQPVNTYLGAWYNAADPDTAATPDWAIKASFSFVFPK